MTIAALVAAAVIGAVVWWGVTQAQQARRQQEIEASRVIVGPGKAYGVYSSQFAWDGTMEVTLTRSAWYESLDAASEAEDLGDVSDYASRGAGGYVVCELVLHSVDAVPIFYEENRLNVSVFRLLMADGTTMAIPESVWSNAPKVKDEHSAIYVLVLSQGDTASVVLGFPLDEVEPLDKLMLTCFTPQTQFSLGLAA